MKNALIEKLDAAFTEPKPDQYQWLREYAEVGSIRGHGHGVRQSWQSQATAETFIEIGRATVKPKVAVEKIKLKRKEWLKIWAEHTALGNSRTSADFHKYVGDVAKQIVDGKETGDVSGPDEWEAEKQAMFRAQKRACHSLNLEIHEALVPIIESADKVARDMLSKELDSEIERAVRWGFSITQPSAVALSLRAAIEYFAQRKTAPPMATSPDDQCLHLIDFD